MSRSPISALIDKGIIDKGMRCTRCDAPMGQCDCWTTVTLRCPECKRTKQVTKHETDPPNTAIVEAPCDKCDRGGDKPETMYFDMKDRQLHPQTGELLAGSVKS